MDAVVFFFFNDTATTEIYTLSLHDALPIYPAYGGFCGGPGSAGKCLGPVLEADARDNDRDDPDYYGRPESDHYQERKSTRLNSRHSQISYAVFCLKTKKALRAVSNRPRPPP